MARLKKTWHYCRHKWNSYSPISSRWRAYSPIFRRREEIEDDWDEISWDFEPENGSGKTRWGRMLDGFNNRVDAWVDVFLCLQLLVYLVKHKKVPEDQ